MVGSSRATSSRCAVERVIRPLVVVVAKRSMYERFIQERSDPKAVALFQRHDISVARWRQAHLAHQRTLKQVQLILRSLGARLMVLRSPGVVFDAASKGAQAYIDFARELVQRVKGLHA